MRDKERMVDESGLPEDVVKDYLKHKKEELTQLRQLLEEGDFRACERIAHKIKGTAEAFGFPDFGEVSKELEEACKALDQEQASFCLSKMEKLLNEQSHQRD